METTKSKNTLNILKPSMYTTGVVGSVDPPFVDPKKVQNLHFWLLSLTQKYILSFWPDLVMYELHVVIFYFHKYCIPENGYYKIKKYLKDSGNILKYHEISMYIAALDNLNL